MELRRGAIVVAVLAQLRTEQYGYSLRQELSAAGMSVEEGTLYPLIRRLEQQGLLHSEWRTEDRRRKRFYRLSELGFETLAQLTEDWTRISQSLDTQLGKE